MDCYVCVCVYLFISVSLFHFWVSQYVLAFYSTVWPASKSSGKHQSINKWAIYMQCNVMIRYRFIPFTLTVIYMLNSEVRGESHKPSMENYNRLLNYNIRLIHLLLLQVHCFWWLGEIFDVIVSILRMRLPYWQMYLSVCSFINNPILCVSVQHYHITGPHHTITVCDESISFQKCVLDLILFALFIVRKTEEDSNWCGIAHKNCTADINGDIRTIFRLVCVQRPL